MTTANPTEHEAAESVRAAAPPNTASARSRRAFKLINRWIAVPALASGLGAWIGTPIGGWLLLLRVRGRRSGLVRSVPLSYLISDGDIWVAAGYGRGADWFVNTMAEPRVEVVLPGRTVVCLAEEVTDEAVRSRILPDYLKAVGLPATLGGVNPWRSSENEITRLMADVPLVRLRPLGDPVAAGPDDPGGSGWMWRQAMLIVAAVAVCRRLLR